jgi:hypothetical protein
VIVGIIYLAKTDCNKLQLVDIKQFEQFSLILVLKFILSGNFVGFSGLATTVVIAVRPLIILHLEN